MRTAIFHVSVPVGSQPHERQGEARRQAEEWGRNHGMQILGTPREHRQSDDPAVPQFEFWAYKVDFA